MHIPPPLPCVQRNVSIYGLDLFYCGMWKHRSHLLFLLFTFPSKNRLWKWRNSLKKSFKDANSIIAKDIILSCPNIGEEFITTIGASTTQLGGVNFLK